MKAERSIAVNPRKRKWVFLCDVDEERQLGVALHGVLQVLVGDQGVVSPRVVIAVLHHDLLVDLQSIRKLVLEMLHADTGRNANGNEVILEEHLDLHRTGIRGARDLGQGAGLPVDRWCWRATVGVQGGLSTLLLRGPVWGRVHGHL